MLEPLGYWETLRDVEQLFKHTGPLDKYYLPEETTPLYLPDEPWADST